MDEKNINDSKNISTAPLTVGRGNINFDSDTTEINNYGDGDIIINKNYQQEISPDKGYSKMDLIKVFIDSIRECASKPNNVVPLNQVWTIMKMTYPKLSKEEFQSAVSEIEEWGLITKIESYSLKLTY